MLRLLKQVYGDILLYRTQVNVLFHRFKDGGETENDLKNSRIKTSSTGNNIENENIYYFSSPQNNKYYKPI